MHTEATPHFDPARLRAATTEANLTQQDVAMRLGASMRGVQKWFLGESEPRGGKLIALSRLLDRDPDWFFTDEPQEKEAA